MKIENFIALRYIIKGKNNKDITSATVIAVSVIALSIIFFIISVSIMNGYIYGIMKLAIEVKTSHIDIQTYNNFEDSLSIADRLSALSTIKDIEYAGLYRETKVLLSANSKNTGIFYFKCINEDSFSKDKNLSQCIKLLEGRKSILKNEIMISKKTSEKLKVKVSDSIFLISYISKDTPKITLYRLKVSGIFTTGYIEIDEQLAYIGRETGDKVLGKDVPYFISIKLKDYLKAVSVTKLLKKYGYTDVTSWLDANYNEFTALKFEKNVIAFIVIIALFVAVLNILTTLYIIVNEKKNDIGILKAFGFSPKNINLVFIMYAVYLGFIGIAAGVSAGLLLMNMLNKLLLILSDVINFILGLNYFIASKFIYLEPFSKFEIFSKDFYLDRIYTDISIYEIILISALTFIFSIIASIIPAFSSSRIKPIEVIKNG
jgi:lipoprotein-releasing system permease protein